MKMRKEKGVALIIAVILCSVLMLIATTLSTVAINESESSVRIDDSTNAYNNAEAGLQWALYYIAQGNTSTNSYAFGSGNSTFTVNINNTTSPMTIDSIGTDNGIKRKVHYIINPINKIPQQCSGSGYPLTSQAGSFTWQFDFTLNNTTPSTVNLSDNASTPNVLSMKYSYVGAYPSFNLFANTTGSTNPINIGSSFPSSLLNNTYEFRAVIKYLPGIAAQIEIEYRDANSNLQCLGTTWVSLVGDNFGTFSSLSLTPGGSCNNPDSYSMSDDPAAGGTGGISVTNMILNSGAQ